MPVEGIATNDPGIVGKTCYQCGRFATHPYGTVYLCCQCHSGSEEGVFTREETYEWHLERLVYRHLEGVEGPFRTYANPMRNDGVFIGQDKAIKPYDTTGMGGQLRYPATPQDAACFPYQIPHALAERIVQILNNGGYTDAEMKCRGCTGPCGQCEKGEDNDGCGEGCNGRETGLSS